MSMAWVPALTLPGLSEIVQVPFVHWPPAIGQASQAVGDTPPAPVDAPGSHDPPMAPLPMVMFVPPVPVPPWPVVLVALAPPAPPVVEAVSAPVPAEQDAAAPEAAESAARRIRLQGLRRFMASISEGW